MKFLNRGYGVVDLLASPKPELAWFNQLRGQGIIQKSLSSVRKSVDGNKMIIKWNTNGHPTPSKASPHFTFSGTHSEMLAHIAANLAEWDDT